jgi:fatty acid desaturase
MDTIDQTPLPAALQSDRTRLSPEVRAEIQALSGARLLAFLGQLIFAWLVIVGAIAVALAANHWLISLLAIVVVATRHNVLALLVHEQVHRLGLRGKYGDLFVNLTAAYPLLIGLICVRWLSRKNKLSGTDATVLKWRRLCYNGRLSPFRH